MALQAWTYDFAKLKLMSALGIIPRRLASVRPPKYDGCIFGAMNKKPWRTRAAK
jgi:hypothetical protein